MMTVGAGFLAVAFFAFDLPGGFRFVTLLLPSAWRGSRA
jgi:hypothetical protein